MSWQCPQCDAYNEDSLTECDICGAARPAGAVTRSDPPKAGADPAKFRPEPIKKPEAAKKVSPPKAERKPDAYTSLKKEAASGAEAAREEVGRMIAEAAKAEAARKLEEAERERKAREAARLESERRAREHARRYWRRIIRRVVFGALLLVAVIWIIGQVKHYRETQRYFEEAYQIETEGNAFSTEVGDNAPDTNVTNNPVGDTGEESVKNESEVGDSESAEDLSPFEQAVRDRRDSKSGD